MSHPTARASSDAHERVTSDRSPCCPACGDACPPLAAECGCGARLLPTDANRRLAAAARP